MVIEVVLLFALLNKKDIEDSSLVMLEEKTVEP